ncbi:WxcM-like domain-containing protein [Rufibacter immobilis]|uniref:WxcM-like domain-containing protein n=1 Tax=Rufibacter immobilis TaxID=1348778 RepID=A0A3M9MXJ9_9BACT|nr:FdtA/QdtA family cupin domain-containing protein [Rufibacter immobilis]RNI29593.1 WxcM-like domain-containing protein [Rufibacter immobilis]
MTTPEPQLLPLRHLPDAAGTLVSTQDTTGLPFAVQRVFWVFASAQGTQRGGHAHRTTQELLVVVQGTVRVETQTAQGRKTFELTGPTQSLYIPPLCWITVHPSANAVLCCMTSTVFNEADYIREHAVFQNEIN